VDVWNAWRTEQPEIRPDLSFAKIDGPVFFRVDFRGANLEHSDLSRVTIVDSDLSNANLGGAELRRTVLNDSRVRTVNVINADLHRADFTGTDFAESNFAGSSFEGTRLVRADFERAVFGGTVFGNVDLSGARNLGSAVHHAPSTIGIDTIYESKGKIPEGFLRGAGVPENFITYMRSLAGAAFDFYSCFISYSTKDQEFADRLYSDLQAKGVRCWFAPHDIQGGRKLHEQIDEAIKVYDKLLLILSDASMSSEWVSTEISKARKRERQESRRKLFPISLSPFEAVQDWECFDADAGKDSARAIREYFIPDFSNWKNHDSYKQAYERLVRDLKAGPGDKKAV